MTIHTSTVFGRSISNAATWFCNTGIQAVKGLEREISIIKIGIDYTPSLTTLVEVGLIPAAMIVGSYSTAKWLKTSSKAETIGFAIIGGVSIAIAFYQADSALTFLFQKGITVCTERLKHCLPEWQACASLFSIATKCK